MKSIVGILLLGLSVFLSVCSDRDVVDSGKIVFHFEHLLEGAPIDFDNLLYRNEAGNKYEISEIQWFLSDITLRDMQGNDIIPDDSVFAHYIDTDRSDTWTWEKTNIPAGDYSTISMTFGIKGEKNLPMTFVNPPESDMLWPLPMGGPNGGYHYMKLNGFWLDSTNQRQAFNFHIGVGKIDDNGDPEFVQNWFETELNNSAFSISKDETRVITIVMNVEEWFKNPDTYDHDIYGGKIMDNQEAMQKACTNGANGVFTIGKIE